MDIQRAAREGRAKLVEKKISEGDIADQWSVAQACAQGESEETAMVLLRAGMAPSKLLWGAAWAGSASMARLALSKGADVDIEQNVNRPIHVAQSAEIVSLLLEAGAKADVRNSFGASPLDIAIDTLKKADHVKILLDHGADPNARDHNGNPPLSIALGSNNHAINAGAALALLAKGADPDAIGKRWAPVQLVAENAKSIENEDVVKLLAALKERGANFHVTTGGEGRECALTIAANRSNADVIEALVANGADPAKRDKEIALAGGENLIAIASGNRYNSNFFRTVEALAKNGAALNAGRPGAKIPLAEVLNCECDPDQRIKAAKLMLDLGADPNVAGQDNESMLAKAAAQGPDFLEALVEKGARMDFRAGGKKAFEQAMECVVDEGRSRGAVRSSLILVEAMAKLAIEKTRAIEHEQGKEEYSVAGKGFVLKAGSISSARGRASVSVAMWAISPRFSR